MPNIVPRQSINIPTGVAPPPAMAIATGLKGVAGIAEQVEKGNRQEDEFKLKVAEARETNEAIRAYNEKQVWRLKFQEEVRRNENPEDYLDVFKSGLDDYNQELTNGRSAVFTNKFLQLDRISDFNALGRMGTAMRDDLESEYIVSQELVANEIIERNDENSFNDLQWLIASMDDDQFLTPEKRVEMTEKFDRKYARNYIASLGPEDALTVLRDESNPISQMLSAEERNTLEGNAYSRFNRKQDLRKIQSTLVRNNISTSIIESLYGPNALSAEEALSRIMEAEMSDAERKHALDTLRSHTGELDIDMDGVSAEDISANNKLYKTVVNQIYTRLENHLEGDIIEDGKAEAYAEQLSMIRQEIEQTYANGGLKRDQMIGFMFDIGIMNNSLLSKAESGKRYLVAEHKEVPSIAYYVKSEADKLAERYNKILTPTEISELVYRVKARSLAEVKPPDDVGFFESPTHIPLKGSSVMMEEQKKAVQKIIYEERKIIEDGKGIFSDKDKEDFRNNSQPKGSIPPPTVAKNNLEAYKTKHGEYPERQSIIELFVKAGLGPDEAAKQADAYN